MKRPGFWQGLWCSLRRHPQSEEVVTVGRRLKRTMVRSACVCGKFAHTKSVMDWVVKPDWLLGRHVERRRQFKGSNPRTTKA